MYAVFGRQTSRYVWLGALLGLGLFVVGNAGQAVAAPLAITGAGATFPAPLYEKWISEYSARNLGVTIAYRAIGSGEGVKRFIAGDIDFGASDSAMSDEQIARVARGVQLVPATAGMVVLAYNLKGLNGALRLPRQVYVDIFAGKIRRWNDPRIVEANPGTDFPAKDITIVARKDGSGTTYAFTNHLSAVSSEWRDRGPGVGTSVDWPGNAMVAPGNEGVAARIKMSEGAIGYVEYGFANRLGLPMAWLENRAGRFIAPDAEAGRRAFQDNLAQMPQNLRVFLPDPEGTSSYPIVTLSWLLLYREHPSARVSAALKAFVTWGLTDGQRIAEAMGYVPLPDELVALSQGAIAALE
jgi:phosphate transport system substrate-binding protein